MSTQPPVVPKFEMPLIPSPKEAEKLTKPLIAQSLEFKIADEECYIASWALVERHDAAIAKIGELFDPFVSGLYKLHKAAVELRAYFLDPIVASKKRLLDSRGVYRLAQEKIKKEKAEHDAEILRKQQAKDLEKEAKKIERAGDVETATVLREQAKTLPAPVVPVLPAAPKQAGSVLKTSWKFVVENPDIVPHEYFTLDESKIRKVVNALGDKANIPGVRIWPDTAEHSRAVK